MKWEGGWFPTRRLCGKSFGAAGRLAVPSLRAGDRSGMVNDGLRRLCRRDDGFEGVRMLRDVRQRDRGGEGESGHYKYLPRGQAWSGILMAVSTYTRNRKGRRVGVAASPELYLLRQ